MVFFLSSGFPGKEWARQGRQVGASLGFDSLNNFSRLWAIGVVSGCLVPGSGNIGLCVRVR